MPGAGEYKGQDGSAKRPYRVPAEFNDCKSDDRRRESEPELHLVVLMGMLDYYVMGEFEDEAVAERELAWWQEKARSNVGRPGVSILPVSYHVTEHDFQVRTQKSLDDLVDAIQRSYR